MTTSSVFAGIRGRALYEPALGLVLSFGCLQTLSLPVSPLTLISPSSPSSAFAPKYKGKRRQLSGPRVGIEIRHLTAH
jgi:hypothetical protein